MAGTITTHNQQGPDTLPASRPAEAEALIEQFEAIYQEAEGDPSRIPWAHARPCPAMVAWLNAEAPCLIRPGARVAVVGCGLGNDAVLLAQRGYDVLAFDICPTAIDWAKRLHPDHASSFIVADLFDLPAKMRHRFDLVVDVHTLQSLPPTCRTEMARGMASMVCHGGHLLAICRGRDPEIPLAEVSAWIAARRS